MLALLVARLREPADAALARAMRHHYTLGVRSLFQRAAGVGGASTVHSLATGIVASRDRPDEDGLLALRAEYRAWRQGSTAHHHRARYPSRIVSIKSGGLQALLLDSPSDASPSPPRLTLPAAACSSRLETDFDVESARVLGEGGFGVVYAATSRTDGRRYALKLLPHGGLRMPPPAEARCLASLAPHENLVGYYGTWSEHSSVQQLRSALGALAAPAASPSLAVGELDGDEEEQEEEGESLDPDSSAASAASAASASGRALVLQLELVAAPTLHCILRREMASRGASLGGWAGGVSGASNTEAPGLPLEVRWRWMAGVARALHWMHASGWLHNDVKPSNIFCAPDGSSKLCDMGLASEWQSAAASPQASSPQDSSSPVAASPHIPSEPSDSMAVGIDVPVRLRPTGGTPVYMSPERLNKERRLPLLVSTPRLEGGSMPGSPRPSSQSHVGDAWCDGPGCAQAPSSDVYSLGVVCAETFGQFGTAMERAVVLEQLKRDCHRRGFTITCKDDAHSARRLANPDADALVREMLAEVSDERPTAIAVEVAAMQHARRALDEFRCSVAPSGVGVARGSAPVV